MNTDEHGLYDLGFGPPASPESASGGRPACHARHERAGWRAGNADFGFKKWMMSSFIFCFSGFMAAKNF